MNLGQSMTLDEVAPRPAGKAGAGRELTLGDSGSIVPRLATLDKAWLTLQARAALTGFRAELAAGGAIVVSRWGFERRFDGVAAFEEFLERVAPSVTVGGAP